MMWFRHSTSAIVVDFIIVNGVVDVFEVFVDDVVYIATVFATSVFVDIVEVAIISYAVILLASCHCCWEQFCFGKVFVTVVGGVEKVVVFYAVVYVIVVVVVVAVEKVDLIF